MKCYYRFLGSILVWAQTQYQACKDRQEVRACKILNNPKHIYQLSISKYQAYIDVNNKSMQEINTCELREW